jgi:hypothetical protein
MSQFEFDWTVMVYLSGDNCLSSEMLWAITEIAKATEGQEPKLSNRIALTVQYDPLSMACGTLRYAYPKRDVVPEQGADAGRRPLPTFAVPFRSALSEHRTQEDAASRATLRDFVKWSAKAFPSSRYRMLVLSGHGGGAEGDFLTDENPGPQATTGADRDSGSAVAAGGQPSLPQPGVMSMPALRGALAASAVPDGVRIDVLGMDSCLMSTLEVAQEVSELAEFLVASEGFVPNTGWPYAELLAEFTRRIDQDNFGPEAMSATIVDTCATYYGPYLPADVSLDVAACNLNVFGEVTDRVRDLTTGLIDRIGDVRVQNALILAHWRAQSFKFEQYTDLWDFCQELITNIGQADDIAERCREVMGAIDDAMGVVTGSDDPKPRGRQRSLGLDFQHAHGLSVYFPWCQPSGIGVDLLNEYAKLDFPKNSGWGDFLREYLSRTMRNPRPVNGKSMPKLLTLDASGTGLRSRTKNVSGYNKNVSGYNKFLSELFGGRVPWGMKNPPQRVDVTPQTPALKGQT